MLLKCEEMKGQSIYSPTEAGFGREDLETVLTFYIFAWRGSSQDLDLHPCGCKFKTFNIIDEMEEQQE